MRKVAPLVSLLLLVTLATPAYAGFSPNVRVQDRPTGVDLGARTPGAPGSAATEPAPTGPGGDARKVSCLYVPATSLSGGLTFAATCSDPAATSVPFDPFGNARFVLPQPAGAGQPAQPAPPGGQPTVAPGMLASQAARFLPLPAPVIRTNPTPDHDQVVNLATWLWAAPTSWDRRTATASVPGLSVTVTAVPTTLTWTMGDGGRTVCQGPGTPYDPTRALAVQRTTCSYTYRRSSAGEPDGRCQVSATTIWRVTWVASGSVDASGTLPPLARSAQTTLRVVEAQTLN